MPKKRRKLSYMFHFLQISRSPNQFELRFLATDNFYFKSFEMQNQKTEGEKGSAKEEGRY